MELTLYLSYELVSWACYHLFLELFSQVFFSRFNLLEVVLIFPILVLIIDKGTTWQQF